MLRVNSVWPSDAICRSCSTLAWVKAWCLTAPSHYLNLCRLIINEVFLYSPEGNFIGNAHDAKHCNLIENYSSKISFKFLRGQWVNALGDRLLMPWSHFMVEDHQQPHFWHHAVKKHHIDGLVQDCSISNALSIEMLQSCAKPSISYRICVISQPLYRRLSARLQ